MRNDFIGTSIDGDARAACNCHSNGANTINTAGNGCCDNNTPHQNRSGNACGCNNYNARQPRGKGHNDCDNNYRQPRSKGCNECDNYARQGRGNDCNECDNNNRHSRNHSYNDYDCDHNKQDHHNDGCSCNGRTPAMVYAEHHDLDSMYCAEKALIRGTLFGCLDKPMCNERCSDNPCTSQCQEDKFTIWELRLYLNTHPCDQKALALLHKLIEQMDHDCSCPFHPDCNRWSWIDGPWPWEYQRCCGKEA